MANWKDKLEHAFSITGDDFQTMSTTLTEEELIVEFDDGIGEIEGKPFTAWGDNYVYFPVVYNGDECVGFAPRDYCDVKTNLLKLG